MRKGVMRHPFSDEIKKNIRKLLVLDNWHCWLAVITDYSIIVAAVWLAVDVSWYFYPLSILLIGSRQRALATITHESAHGSIAKNKRLNHLMGTVFSGYWIFQTMGSYYKSHVQQHHAHFGDEKKDPDYEYALKQGLYTKQEPSLARKKYLLFPLLLSKLPSYFIYVFFHRFLDEKNSKETILMMSFWLIILAISVYMGFTGYLILLWIIPYFTVFHIIGWFIELSEHHPLMENNTTLHMSRNRHSHPIEAFFTGMHNEHLHLIHHLFPTIPFWNLPKAHQILLQDANYRKQDDEAGGIFWSNNKNPSVFQKFGYSPSPVK